MTTIDNLATALAEASMIATVEHLAEQMCKAVTNNWKVDAIESNRETHYTLEVQSVGRKYIKITSKLNTDPADRIGHAYMFIDKNTGICYGAKTYNQADSMKRGTVTQFIEYPYMCSPYGGFAYIASMIAK